MRLPKPLVPPFACDCRKCLAFYALASFGVDGFDFEPRSPFDTTIACPSCGSDARRQVPDIRVSEFTSVTALQHAVFSCDGCRATLFDLVKRAATEMYLSKQVEREEA